MMLANSGQFYTPLPAGVFSSDVQDTPTHTIVILVCVVRQEGEDKTRNDKSGSEALKSDSKGKVQDIVGETGTGPATTH